MINRRDIEQFKALSWPDKNLILEAAILVLIFKFGVRVVPFKHIDRFLRAKYASPRNDQDDIAKHASDIHRVKLALARVVNRVHFKNLCLSRSIAAFIMLRRRAIPAEIIVGVQVIADGTLGAHAWIRTGRECREECAKHGAFTPLLTIQ